MMLLRTFDGYEDFAYWYKVQSVMDKPLKVELCGDINLHVIQSDPETKQLLRQIIANQKKEFTQIMATLDDVLADVSAETTLVASVATLVQGLKDQLAAQGVDQAKIDAAF